MKEKLRTREGKKFLLSVMIVFAIALTVVTRATFGGVVREYNMPMSEWPLSVYILQSAMVLVYSFLFTVIGSLPFGFYFLGSRDERG